MSIKNAEISLEYTENVFIGHTTNKPLTNFWHWKSWKYNEFWELGPDKKNC